MDEHEEDCALLEAIVGRLKKRFEAVQVFASRAGKDGTTSHQRGAGNVYARVAHAREWVLKAEETARIEAREEAEADREGDDA